MSTFHTQQQSLCQLGSTRMKEKPLLENAVLPDTETKKLACILSLSIKSVLFLFQTNFANWQCKTFDQFYDSTELKKGSCYKRL